MWIGTQLQSFCLVGNTASGTYTTATHHVISNLRANTFSLGDQSGFDATSASQGFAGCNFVVTTKAAFDAQPQTTVNHDESRLNLCLHRTYRTTMTSPARRAA